MILSIIVYGALALLLFYFGVMASHREYENMRYNRSTPFWTGEVMFALLFFSFISGVRWRVGVDYQHYLAGYQSIQNLGYSIFEKEIGFNIITSAFASSGVHFSFYFGFFAFLQIFFVYRAFKDERYLYPFLGVVILLGPHYLSWMNGMRQMLVAAAFVWVVPLIFKREFLKYLAFIVLASLMHKSAMLLIVLYFIPNRDYFSNRTLTILLVIVSLWLGNNYFWIEHLNKLSVVLDWLGYGFYSERLHSLVDETDGSAIGPRRIAIILLMLMTVWYGPSLKRYFEKTLFIFYYNYSILGFLLYNLFADAHHIFMRPVTYLTIFSIPVTAYLIWMLFRQKSKQIFGLLLVFLLAISFLPLSMIADSGKGLVDYTNYKFYWNYIY